MTAAATTGRRVGPRSTGRRPGKPVASDPGWASRPPEGRWARPRHLAAAWADRPRRCPSGCELVWLLPPDPAGEAIAGCACTLAALAPYRPGHVLPPGPLWRLVAPGGVPRLVATFKSQAPLTWRLAVALLERLTAPSALPGPP